MSVLFMIKGFIDQTDQTNYYNLNSIKWNCADEMTIKRKRHNERIREDIGPYRKNSDIANFHFDRNCCRLTTYRRRFARAAPALPLKNCRLSIGIATAYIQLHVACSI